MNKKGFTLIELLAVIILISIIGIVVFPSVLDDVKIGKDKSYKILVKNIKVAAENYYQECEYDDLSNMEKYGSNACSINDNTISITIGTLVDTGLLNTGDKVVKDPKTDESINDCGIKITKKRTKLKDSNNIEHSKFTYTICSSGELGCPTNKEYGSTDEQCS